MAQTLGEKLRQARQEQGISISEVAEQTRIAPLYIESIENDDYKPLPGGIFNKGFVKSYAKYVGVDEQEALNDYAALIAASDLPAEHQPRSYRPEVLTDDRAMSSLLPTVLLAAVILGLMTAGVLFLVNYLQNNPDEAFLVTNSANTAENVNAANQQGETEPTPAAPSLEGATFEFAAANEPVWLSYTVDGNRSTAEVSPGKSVVLNPKTGLTLSYHRARAQYASLSVNGKPITLPSTPANIKSSTIDIEITRENFPEVWRSGQYTAPNTVEPASTPAETVPERRAAARPKPSPNRPAANRPSTTGSRPSASPRASDDQ